MPNENSVEWKVGEVVAVIVRSRVYKRSVKQVLKRYIELSDRSKWKPYGGPHPAEPFPQRHIEKWTPKHEASWKRSKATENILRRVTAENLDRLPLDKLFSLEEITESLRS